MEAPKVSESFVMFGSNDIFGEKARPCRAHARTLASSYAEFLRQIADGTSSSACYDVIPSSIFGGDPLRPVLFTSCSHTFI
jgi:hypothetical protein